MRKVVRVPNEVVETYKAGKFYVEICKESDNTYTAYLHHEEYAIKCGMFGESIEDTTLDEFVALVMESLDEYIEDYKDEFFDD